MLLLFVIVGNSDYDYMHMNMRLLLTTTINNADNFQLQAVISRDEIAEASVGLGNAITNAIVERVIED